MPWALRQSGASCSLPHPKGGLRWNPRSPAGLRFCSSPRRFVSWCMAWTTFLSKDGPTLPSNLSAGLESRNPNRRPCAHGTRYRLPIHAHVKEHRQGRNIITHDDGVLPHKGFVGDLVRGHQREPFCVLGFVGFCPKMGAYCPSEWTVFRVGQVGW